MENDSINNRIAYLAAFSMAFGCIIGWSNFVTPGTMYIPRAGVLGAIVGIVIASVIAQLICVNYIGLSRAFPEAGNSYLLVKNVFDMDHAFFSAWALLLAYLCVFWANLISVSFLARFLFEDSILYSVHYSVVGFDVYPGDILISIIFLLLAAFIVCRGNKTTFKIITFLSMAVLLSIVVIFCIVMSKADLGTLFTPAFSSTTTMSHGAQIMSIAVMAPWIFVGFEAVSHVDVTGKIKLNRVFIAAGCAIIVATMVCIMLTLIINSCPPDGFRNWEDYMIMSGSVHCFAEIPVYYSVHSIMGDEGIGLLFIAMFCTLFSSVLGLMLAASLTIRTMADDQLTPVAFTKVNKQGIPYSAIHLIVFISIPILFLGMNIVGWALNVSTIAICIVYGYISLGTFLKAEDNIRFKVCGILGTFLSIAIFVIFIIPGSAAGSLLTTEDYLILALWALSGLICYRFVLQLDKNNRLGKSMITWLLMFFLLFYATNMWTHDRMQEDLQTAVDSREVEAILTTNNLIRTLVVVIALIILFELFSIMLHRNSEMDRKIAREEERSYMRNTLLSNMSHDIRTPLNAIVGFTDLALLDKDDSKKMSEYLEKIRISGTHLLSLINDVLEMSRIENGQLELHEEAVDLPEFIRHIKTLASGDADARQLDFNTDINPMDDPDILCDRNRLKHVLLYLVTSAIRRCSDKGSVTLGVMQLERTKEGRGLYEFVIKDNGTLIPYDLIKKVTDPEAVDDRDTVSDAHGLSFGLSVTKMILNTMGGHIEIKSDAESGNQIYVTMEFDISESEVVAGIGDKLALLDGRRALIVDDIMINRQIVVAMMEMYGMETEEARDGEEALFILQSALPGHYDVVLMDIQMPKLNGFDTARAIRELPDPINSAVPIFAMTANVFDEDKEKAFESGMNGFIPKPVDREYLVSSLAEVFKETPDH